MRDTGTEMTPIGSPDPSRTSTPAGATTPLCSPTISIPSTPGREPPPAPTSDRSLHMDHKRTVSEHEQKLKTRREIIALGKKNIAAWASKEEETVCNIFFSKIG
uniref:Uncharacterized protein n=1 Tax=Kalanchoe fedtschenkoi TaxID=63787 RepID=A0A7N0T3J5_KALFE